MEAQPLNSLSALRPGKGAMRCHPGSILPLPPAITPTPTKQPLGPRSFSGPRLGKMGVKKGKAQVDLDSRFRAAWAGNSDILWSRKEIVPSLPLGFMESSLLGRGIQLEEGQNRASNLEA